MAEKKELNIQIGERVKRSRERRQLTQEQFAETLNVSTQYVSDLERGKTGASVSTLRKICVALAVSCDYVLLGKEDGNAALSRLVNEISNLEPRYLPMLEGIVRNYVEAVTLSS